VKDACGNDVELKRKKGGPKAAISKS